MDEYAQTVSIIGVFYGGQDHEEMLSFAPLQRWGVSSDIRNWSEPLWGLGYERVACHADDPWLAYAARHTEPLRASGFSCLSDRQRAMVGLAESFGFRSVVVVPAPTAGLSRPGMLVLGSELDGYVEGDGYPALKVLGRSLAMSLHECYITLIARDLLANSRLSNEDLRLLA